MPRIDSYQWITINSDGQTVSSVTNGSRFKLNISPAIDLGGGNHEIALHSLTISPASVANRIFVYCNLAQPQHINNSKFSLVRAIGFSPVSSTQSYELGNSLQWIRMMEVRNISEIEIQIADSQGNDIQTTAPTMLVFAIRDL